MRQRKDKEGRKLKRKEKGKTEDLLGSFLKESS
jgi:hypothetical protein